MSGLDKRKLRKIPTLTATPEDVSRARLNHEASGKKTKAYFACHLCDVDGVQILTMEMFFFDDLTAGNLKPAKRLYFSADNYLTLNVGESKWQTGTMPNAMGSSYTTYDYNIGGYSGYRITNCDFLSPGYAGIAESFFPPESLSSGLSIWHRIVIWQSDIMDARREAGYEKDKQSFQRQQEVVPELPPGFSDWMEEYAGRPFRLVIYNAKGKENLSGFCSVCKETVSISRKKDKPGHGRAGICPSCKATVIYKAEGKISKYDNAFCHACIIQKVDKNGLVLRHFQKFARMNKNLSESPNEKFLYPEDKEFHECYRVFYYPVGYAQKFKWGTYKMSKDKCWHPLLYSEKFMESAVLYTDNLPYELALSDYKYCAVDVLQKNDPYKPNPIDDYFDKFPKRPHTEYLIKMGLYNLIRKTLAAGINPIIHPEASRPADALGISEGSLKILINKDGDNTMLDFMRICELHGIDFDSKAVKTFASRFGDVRTYVHTAEDELKKVLRLTKKLSNFLNYSEKQVTAMMENEPKGDIVQGCWHSGGVRKKSFSERKRQKYRNFIKDWHDYIGWSKELKYDMNDEYVIFPPDFIKAHDRLMEEHEALRLEKEKKKEMEFDRKIKKIMAENRKKSPFDFASGGLIIVTPKGLEDIRNEGRVLHHCVGDRAAAVAEGFTTICFIREVSAPDEPYYTLEYNNGRLIQCRGKSNKAAPAKIKEFATAFTNKLQKYEKEVEKKKQGIGKAKRT